MNFKYKIIDHPKYKYELTEDFSIDLLFNPPNEIDSRFYHFGSVGKLFVLKGYRWDGASGPTIDTENTMLASCVHDVLYQMMRERQLSHIFKDKADIELGRIMYEQGKKTFFNRIRSSYFYYAVKLFGGFACKPKKVNNERKT